MIVPYSAWPWTNTSSLSTTVQEKNYSIHIFQIAHARIGLFALDPFNSSFISIIEKILPKIQIERTPLPPTPKRQQCTNMCSTKVKWAHLRHFPNWSMYLTHFNIRVSYVYYTIQVEINISYEKGICVWCKKLVSNVGIKTLVISRR